MRPHILSIIVLCLTCFPLAGQTLNWKGNFEYFFDNAEFDRSTLVDDYTVSGIHIAPQIGINWDQHHSIFGGVDVMTLSGSKQVIDQAKVLGYYQYKSDNNTFYAGAFPRADLFSNYSELFFQDSVNFFRPVIQGLYFKHGTADAFVNVWLDWNGLRSPTDRETFFVGASGYKKWNLFFGNFQMYMFHFANTIPSNPTFSVCDNFQGQVSAGIDLSERVPLDKLLFSAGALIGFERDRGMMDQPHAPIGGVIESELAYKIVGLDLLYYGGNKRMEFYDQYSSGLYWSTPFLQSNHYLQAKLYLKVLNNRYVQAKLSLKTHSSENRFFFEQQFSLAASLDNILKK